MIITVLKKWQLERSRHYGKQEEYQRAVEKSNLKSTDINKNTSEEKSQSSNIFKKIFGKS